MNVISQESTFWKQAAKHIPSTIPLPMHMAGGPKVEINPQQIVGLFVQYLICVSITSSYMTHIIKNINVKLM